MPSVSVSVPSAPASTSTLPSDSTLVTNTVAVTNVPKAFFHPEIQSLLRAHFETYGSVNQWVPLPGFGRILVVYEINENAETAKVHSDPIVISGSHGRDDTTLRVFRADINPLVSNESYEFDMPAAYFLAPPALEKNFLISPPGSPPVGWEPQVEEPPNSVALADDLMAALQKLELSDRTRHTESGLAILLDPEEGSGVGVYVQSCDDDDVEMHEVKEEDWIYGQTAPARDRWRPIATAMPPLRATVST